MPYLVLKNECPRMMPPVICFGAVLPRNSASDCHHVLPKCRTLTPSSSQIVIFKLTCHLSNHATSAMMASSAGSDAFAIIALLVISLFVLLLLRHFLPLRTTPAYLTVPIFLALALPISIILLVPIDLASTTTQRASRAIWLPTGALLVAWRLTYWLTFALTWYDSVHFILIANETGRSFLSSVNMSTQGIARRKTSSYTL